MPPLVLHVVSTSTDDNSNSLLHKAAKVKTYMNVMRQMFVTEINGAFEIEPECSPYFVFDAGQMQH